MATIISAGFTGAIHAHLTGRPGLVGLPQKPALVRSVVQLPRYNGAALWAVLHRRTITWAEGEDADWLGRFRMSIPCGECRRHWDQMLIRTPPDWLNYFAWSVDRHNEVNTQLGKPAVPIDEARKTWWPA